MATILYPALVALVGALVYAFVKNDARELGRLAFFAGLFWVVYLLSGKAAHF